MVTGVGFPVIDAACSSDKGGFGLSMDTTELLCTNIPVAFLKGETC